MSNVFSNTSEYVAGLDASKEMERQISLAINNLMYQLSFVITSHDIAEELRGDRCVKFLEIDKSYWTIQFEKATLRIESISFLYSCEFGREPLEYLCWTNETKGEKRVNNYLWMRSVRWPKVLMICHAALELLILGLTARFPGMKEYVNDLAEIRKYALTAGK